MKKLFIPCLFACLLSCDSLTKKSEESLPLLDTPPSYISFRVNFPISELEKGVNRVLPDVLFHDAVAMKDAKDTLYLKVDRKGSINMTYKNGELHATIPLKVNAAVRKEVLGMTFTNKDNPIEFSGVLQASAKIDIDEDWNLDVSCRYENFDLGDQATFSMMGMTFNVEKSINSNLDKHTDQLSNVICSAINQSIDLRGIVSKLWTDVQSPIAIAKEPKKLWLHADPIALNGQLIPMDDVLSIHMEYRSNIMITPEQQSTTPKRLGKKGTPLNTKNQLVTYPDIRLSYKDLTEILDEVFRNEEFEYEGYKVKIDKVAVGHIGQRLALNLNVSGDINGSVKVSGTPVFSEDRQLSLAKFKFEIDSDDEMLNMADWAVHTFAEDYLSEQVKVDSKPLFDRLDELIMSGISRELDANKFDLDFNISNISSYQTRLTDQYIQWIFVVEGEAGLTLKNGLFKPR